MADYYNLRASQRIQDIEMMDTMTWTNATGYDVLNNQLITVAGDTNQGMVLIAMAPIANGASGPVLRKGVVTVPAAAQAFTQGQNVQYAASAAAVSQGLTTTGLYCVGMCVEAAGTGAGYVKVAINEGPKAFYVW